MEEVARSIRVSSTNLVQALLLSWCSAGHFFGGLIAGEGSYLETTNGDSFVDGEKRKRFIFSLTLASWDRPLVHTLRSFLGVGGVYDRPPVRAHWQPTTTLRMCASVRNHRIQSHFAHRNIVIPFSEVFLPPSEKRRQFERWRAALDGYERAHPNKWGRGSSICSEPGWTSRCAAAVCAGATTTVSRVTDTAAHVAGIAVGEATFVATGERRFRFAVSLGATDEILCRLLIAYFGVGRISRSARRRAHYDDEVTYYVQRLRHLVEVIVPFMDEHLPPSHKREQYLAWRMQLLDYWEHEARRRRPCTVEGCDQPRRAKGVCRGHYYERYGC